MAICFEPGDWVLFSITHLLSPKTFLSASSSFHLSEIPAYLWRAFLASWPQWVPSTPLAYTRCDSFSLILGNRQWTGPSTDPAACKGLISYQLWRVRMSAWTAPDVSMPRAQKFLPLFPTRGFAFEQAVWKLTSPASSQAFTAQTHTGVCNFSHPSISKLTINYQPFVSKEKELCYLSSWQIICCGFFFSRSPLLLFLGIFAKWVKADF